MNINFDYLGHQLNRGIHHLWSKRLSDRDPNLEGETWLIKQIENHKRKKIRIRNSQ